MKSRERLKRSRWTGYTGAPEFEDSHIFCRTKKQPSLATVEEDLEWDWQILETGVGSLGSIDCGHVYSQIEGKTTGS